MTSTDIVRGEINRFLRLIEPEVICVTGAWPPGISTLGRPSWMRLGGIINSGSNRYSHASLFGINSLDGLEMGLFEI